MKNINMPTPYFLIFLSLLSGMVMPKVVDGTCGYLDVITGGCPNATACSETCLPCYRGIGKVTSACLKPEQALIPYWRCRCVMEGGAPCPPPGPPHCPKDPPINAPYYYNYSYGHKNDTTRQ